MQLCCGLRASYADMILCPFEICCLCHDALLQFYFLLPTLFCLSVTCLLTCHLSHQVALDYIGKRGATVGVTREKRIKYVLTNYPLIPRSWLRVIFYYG